MSRFLPTSGAMDFRSNPPGLAPRVAALVAVVALATTGIAWAASGGLPKVGKVPAVTTPKSAAPLVVPDVREQAFVFAKETLQDAGFAWRVTGTVQGYAANTVVGQSPEPGTRVIDTGAPLITLTLKKNTAYAQKGVAENDSPYTPTALEPTGGAAVASGPAAPAPVTPTTQHRVAKQPTSVRADAAAEPSTTTAAAPAKTAKAASAWPKTRPPAFVVPGAKKEPLDEMPLTERATELGTWLTAHPKPTTANVNYWLYQNAWVVDGARFGWWHGVDALRTLIAVDARADSMWHIGSKSEAAARQALGYVESMTK
jgi:PASTA domain-containing protein